jgi:hypothetical protein
MHQRITEMNFEFVKKKIIQFKLLKPRVSQDEFWAFNYPI